MTRLLAEIDWTLLRNFVIALFIGALVGIDRERHQAERESFASFGGLRTFILLGLAGALAAALSEVYQSALPLFAGVLLVGGLLGVGYVVSARHREELPGLTTELAAVVVFLLGAAAIAGLTEIAVMLAIATTALLAFKDPLHGAVRRLGREDIHAGLKLLFATFIVLPLLPDEPVDPLGAINPYRLWLLVILISSISLIGYAAVRWLGPGRGITLTAIFGGLASSTALTLSFARRSKEQPSLAPVLATGIVIAWGIMFLRVLVLVAVVEVALLGPLVLPMLGLAMVAALVVGGMSYDLKRRNGFADEPTQIPLRNPFSLGFAIRFGLIFAAILLLVAAVGRALPDQWLLAVAALAGLADMDAITLSMGRYATQGGSMGVATGAVVLAAVTNTLVKCGIVMAVGGKVLRPRILVATGALVAAAALLAGVQLVGPGVPEVTVTEVLPP